MEHASGTMAEIIARMRKRAEDPEFQRQAARLWQETDAQAKARAESDRALRLQAMGVPASLWGCLRAPRPGSAIDAVRAFIRSPAQNVFLTLAGPAGRGKTYAACWALDRLGGRYETAAGLVAAGTFGDEARDLWGGLEHAPLAVIDEMGMEYRNPAADANVYALLNLRHAHQRKTILCTNLDAAGFASRYCPDPRDPLRERIRTAGTWVNLPGATLRRHWAEAGRDD